MTPTTIATIAPVESPSSELDFVTVVDVSVFAAASSPAGCLPRTSQHRRRVLRLLPPAGVASIHRTTVPLS